MSERWRTWQAEVYEDPLVYAHLGFEERAALSSEHTGVPLEEVLEQFRELDRRFSFDDPQSRRMAERVLHLYEMDPWPRPVDAEAIAKVAKKRGITHEEARQHIEEMEALTGLSTEVPMQRAIAEAVIILYELHADRLPPPGDPWWSQGSDG